MPEKGGQLALTLVSKLPENVLSQNITSSENKYRKDYHCFERVENREAKSFYFNEMVSHFKFLFWEKKLVVLFKRYVIGLNCFETNVLVGQRERGQQWLKQRKVYQYQYQY